MSISTLSKRLFPLCGLLGCIFIYYVGTRTVAKIDSRKAIVDSLAAYQSLDSLKLRMLDRNTNGIIEQSAGNMPFSKYKVYQDTLDSLNLL